MACSLNGLTVGDSVPVNMLESPARSETFLYHRDDLPLQYSPMSEDSDEARFCEDPTTTSTSSSQPDSPVSPYRYQRPLTSTNSPHLSSSSSSTISHHSHTCPTSMITNATTSTTSPVSRQRGSDTEGRFPSSPSDICHSGDLRRTALLRSVQMRAHPFGYASSSGPSNIDGEERMCFKSMEEDRGYNNREEHVSYTEVSSKSKSCKALDMRLCER
ncbi:unnamed protein product [Arabis nemorensis]|uniref:Uncharacterized protein n=1 Tax=Arabis nemorensis TaxID=586526 RepID=A0A565BZY5_9BRAS|nr:unnamed protein product [Arabis nemorensis]